MVKLVDSKFVPSVFFACFKCHKHTHKYFPGSTLQPFFPRIQLAGSDLLQEERQACSVIPNGESFEAPRKSIFHQRKKQLLADNSDSEGFEFDHIYEEWLLPDSVNMTCH
jgi:hypothetical protein